MLYILKNLMNANQVAKLAHQLILPTNIFLDLIFKYKQKVNACDFIKETTIEVIKKELAEPS